MKHLLLILSFFTINLFGQQKLEALRIISNNVDSTYFDENGSRWFEFTLPILRAYKVNDLLLSDTTLTNCYLIKGNKDYKKYVKANYPGLPFTKEDKKVIGHLDCECYDYIIMMWMYNDYAFGMMTIITTD
jgi:hypothetical protein